MDVCKHLAVGQRGIKQVVVAGGVGHIGLGVGLPARISTLGIIGAVPVLGVVQAPADPCDQFG